MSDWAEILVRTVFLIGESNEYGFEAPIPLVFKLWTKSDITKEQSSRLAVIWPMNASLG